MFVPILRMRSFTPAHDRARSRCAGCAVPLGLACIAAVWAVLARRVVGIGGGRVVWVALCRWDWRGEHPVGSAESMGYVVSRLVVPVAS